MKPEVAQYFSKFTPDIQNRLQRIRTIFFEEVPGADETIKYQMPTILWNGNLIHYAAFKKHIGIYPLPNVLIQMKDELTGYTVGKGSIQLDNDKELPEELLRKIVRKRREEKEQEMNAKAEKKIKTGR